MLGLKGRCWVDDCVAKLRCSYIAPLRQTVNEDGQVSRKSNRVMTLPEDVTIQTVSDDLNPG